MAARLFTSSRVRQHAEISRDSHQRELAASQGLLRGFLLLVALDPLERSLECLSFSYTVALYLAASLCSSPVASTLLTGC